MNSMLYEGCDKIKHNRSNLALQLSYVQKCALCHRVAQHPDHSMLIWQPIAELVKAGLLSITWMILCENAHGAVLRDRAPAPALAIRSPR